MANTTNLNLLIPTVGADLDVWGGENNNVIIAYDAALATAITGLTLSAAGSSASFGIAAGSASGMTITSPYTKTTGSWAVGSGNGSLDSGAIANNTWYHVHAIQRPDTGVVDFLTSLSATAPTLPTSYTRSRRIGSMKTNGSAQWIKFSQFGDEFLWDVPVQDASNVGSSTAASTFTLTVPTGVKVNALFSVLINDTVAGGLYIYSPDVSDQVAAGTGALSLYGPSTQAAPINCRTNTSAQIKTYGTNNTGTLFISTKGWIDTRGKL